MSTLSGATANQLMTNTWLDDKISPKYTTFPFLTFSITWKLKCGTYTTTKICKYNAISISDSRILYGVTNCTHSAGITEAGYNPSITQHFTMSYWGGILSTFYLPIITTNITIGDLLLQAEFQVTEVSNSVDLPLGVYRLSELQYAISSKGTITFENSTTKTSIEKYIYIVSNSGVEYGGNKFNYNGTPPSSITSYISGEANSSKRVITYKDYNNIFTGTASSSKKCVREDVNDFNVVTYYAVIGAVYTTYNGPDHANNVNALTAGGVDLSQNSSCVIIPPTITGLSKWNEANGAGEPAVIYSYLNLNRGGLNKQTTISNGNDQYALNVHDIAWNYESNKAKYEYSDSGKVFAFFGRYLRYDNDGSGSALGSSTRTGLIASENRKIYPGDIFGRQPYITPSILQDSTYDIYKVSYLPYSDAVQYYRHPTMNRSITSSDGLASKSINGTSYAVVPIIYIPSTIRMYTSSGTCSVSVSIEANGYHKLNATFTQNRTFYVYKYAFGNRTAVSGHNSLQRVKESDIWDIDKFLNQLNSGSKFNGEINYTQTQNGVVREYKKTFTPTVTWTKSKDSSGYLILYASAQNYSVQVYNGYIPNSTTVGASSIKLTSSGVDGFLVGSVSSTERTTDTTITVWSGNGGGTSSASLTNVIGDFDNE